MSIPQPEVQSLVLSITFRSAWRAVDRDQLLRATFVRTLADYIRLATILLQPSDRPHQLARNSPIFRNPVLARMSLRENRLDPHRSFFEHFPVPQGRPALRIMAPHRFRTPKACRDLCPHALLRASAVPPEYDRSWLRGEQRSDSVGKCCLLFFVEEVEEGRRMDCGDVSQQWSEGASRLEGRGGRTRGWGRRGKGRAGREEGRREGISGEEGNGESLGRVVEELEAEVPERCMFREVSVRRPNA